MSFLRFAYAAAVVAPLATMSGAAAAQEETEEDSGWFEEDEAPQPTENVGEETPPAETPAIAVEPEAPAAIPPKKKLDVPKGPPEREPNQGRFRWGISPFFGMAKYREQYDDEFRHDDDFAMGLETRFGGQLDDTLALYAVPSIIGSDTLRIATGLVIEATLADTISFGAGMDGILGTDEDWEGALPGLGAQGRLGLHFGKLRPSRRKVFSAYLVGKADYYFHDMGVLMLGGMLGYDAM